MDISLYGERYINSDQFVAYCRGIKADQSFSSGDLELYEREGLLLPVARIIQPSEYVALRRAQFDYGGDPGVAISGWEELENLLYGSHDEGLWHKFDQEFDRQNKYLINPSKTEYEPWDSYQVEVTSSAGEKYMTNENVSHYYHYWQIYQVYKIQSQFPIFSKYHSLYEVLKENTSGWADYFHPGIPNHIVTLYGNYDQFDALSFFMTLYANEQVKTFLEPTGNIRQLSPADIEKYQVRLKQHAEFTVNRFGLNANAESLYEFLLYLLELQSVFRQQEKILLAREIEKDLINLARFIFYAKNQNFEEIQEILGKQTDIFTKKRFRHLDKGLLVKDQAQEIFDELIKNYNPLFHDFSLTNERVEQLLNFLYSNSLFIFPYAIYDIQGTFNQEKTFPRVSLFAGLSNLSVGFESFLRIILSKRMSADGKTLKDLVTDMFKDEKTWWNQFDTKYNELLKKYGRDITIFHLYDTITDPHLHSIAKAVLTTYLTRNFVMHTVALPEEFYQDVFSEIYKSICYSMFYTWSFSLKQGWI